MTPDPISPDLKTVLRRLKLSRMLDTLPERLALARQEKTPHQELLLLVLQDEVQRRDSVAVSLRSEKAHLDPQAQLENWDETAKVSFDRALLGELASLRFLESHHHVLIVGPVGVGKTFLAHALGYIACRRGFSAVDLLILDDFCLDQMDAQESRDAYEILTERHRSGSVVVTSNRGPDEWLATFADPLRAQSVIDRFANNAYDLVIEGESYRSRLKPTLGAARMETTRAAAR
jgi:DNA replication protein DnaC